MKSLTWLSIGLVAALGACSQSLSGNLTGTGGAGAVAGTGTGTGSGGKVSTGAGGTTGYDAAACQTLAAEYDAAMTAAQSCTAGAKAQCTVGVSSSLSVCGACPAFVTDASKLNAIQQMWEAANCDRPIPAPPCATSGPCAPAVPDICIAGPDGHGVCSDAPGTGGTGGAAGSTGAGSSPVDGGEPDVCGAYAMKYATVLETVKSCTFGADGQCAHSVLPSLSVCSAGCNTYVNDSTDLDEIHLLWDQAGCGKGTFACPNILCIPNAGGACTQTDAGGGTCVNYGLLLTH